MPISRFLVAFGSRADLLLRAKHLFVAAIVAGAVGETGLGAQLRYWPNLLLRDKLPTGNEQGGAGMDTVGSGAYTYEPVENWAKLPPGWSFKEIGGVGVDRHDNVFVFNRGEHPMIVFDCDGNFLRSFGEGMFPRAHGVFMAPTTRSGSPTMGTTPSAKLLLSWGGPGTDPGEFNIAHNITCDADGWVYVADREPSRAGVRRQR